MTCSVAHQQARFEGHTIVITVLIGAVQRFPVHFRSLEVLRRLFQGILARPFLHKFIKSIEKHYHFFGGGSMKLSDPQLQQEELQLAELVLLLSILPLPWFSPVAS